jgi:hypothetical protein
LLAAQQAEPSLAQMRSTIVVLVSTAEDAVWAHVGDSRLYHLSGGAIAARTRDHSVSQALVDGGRLDARDQGMHEDRGRLLRCLGKEDEGEPTIATTGRLYHGDTFLLCTDGFWESVDDLAVEIDLAASEDAAAWLDRMEARLRRANGASRDNFTAIAVRMIGETAPLPPPHDPQVPPAWTGGHRPRADAHPPAASGSSRLASFIDMRVLVAAAALLVVLAGAGVWKRDIVRAWARAAWTKVMAAAATDSKDAPKKDAATEKPSAAEKPAATDAEKPARAAAGDKPKPSGEAKRPADVSARDGKEENDERVTASATKRPTSASDRDRKESKGDRVTAPATKKKPGGAGKDGE